MKELVIAFVLYVLYNEYMRNRTMVNYATKAELDALQKVQEARLSSVQNVDVSGMLARLSALEKTPFA